MFSGIVSEIGRIVAVTSWKKGASRIEIAAPKIAGTFRIGDSVSIDGICLTVVSITFNSFTVEGMPETAKVTTLGSWKQERYVNLEPSLKFGDSLGGHLVSGHVDGVSKIRKIIHQNSIKPFDKESSKEPVIMECELPVKLRAFLVRKGSITIDGVSLTVAYLDEDSFSVGLIPHTLEITTLGKKKAGEMVNLETDMIGKFVVRYLEESFLEEGERLPVIRKQSIVCK